MAVKIKNLAIANYRQFRDVIFDFTEPTTGVPLRRVCLIGGNGTGKSTALRALWAALGPPNLSIGPETVAEFTNGITSWCREANLNPFSEQGRPVTDLELELSRTPCLNCRPDSELTPIGKQITDVPDTNLNNALGSLKAPSNRIEVGQDSIAAFWTNLIALIKDREAGWLSFQKLPQNKDRTVRELEEEYFASHPDILKELADFWNVILERASLEFDYEGASVPIQLTDNLKAYIRLREGKGKIAYADLSTGIRHFIFRLGHIFTVFRGDPSQEGIILVDEPENSLHPDFLFDLVSFYEQAAPGAQLFMATHSPIVAAQFRPEERFILEFEESGGVSIRRGVSPEGDDPNDVLLRDFAVRTLYGKKGLEQWRRFRELDRKIQQEPDSAIRRSLMKEYMEIGRTYNFAPEHEIPA